MAATAEPPAAPAIIDAPSTPKFTANAAAKFHSKMKGDPVAAPTVPPPSDPAAKPLPTLDDKTASTKPETTKKLDASENFKRLNADFDNFRATSEKRIKELEAQVSDTTTKYTGELEGTKKELEKHEALVARFYVEHSDKFKAAFDVPLEQRLTEAKEAVGTSKAAELEEILGMKPGETRDRKVKEMAAELDDFDKIGLERSYKEFKKIQKERGLALEKSKTDAKQLWDYEQGQQRNAQQAHQKKVEQVFGDELTTFAKKLSEFRTDEADPERTKFALQNIQTAKDWLSQDLSDPQNIARLVLYAVKGNVSIETDKARDAKIAALEQQIVDMQNSNPGLAGGKPATAKSTGETPGEKFRKAMAGGIPKAA